MSPVRRPSTVSSLRSAAEGGPSAAATVVDEPEPQAQVEPEAQPQPQTQPEAVPAPGPPPRPPKPVRFTLDLSHSQHGFLKRFALEAEVDASKVMRVLLDQLQSDPELAQRVREAAWTVQ
jgi:hypothetical protein